MMCIEHPGKLGLLFNCCHLNERIILLKEEGLSNGASSVNHTGTNVWLLPCNVSKPETLLCDELFGQLDVFTRLSMQIWLSAFSFQEEITTVFMQS